MNKEGSLYTFLYAGAMAIIVATVLVLLSEGTKEMQEINVKSAKMVDILASAGVKATPDDVQAKFDKYIGEHAYAIDMKGEKVITDGKVAFALDLKKELRAKPEDRRLPVYEFRDKGGVVRYILPVYGKGLWGPIWGYVAMNEDKNSIYGVTFGHKTETPGLGAKITEDKFKDSFKGKQLFSGKKLLGITVKKGKAEKGDLHSVDGISGGTITGKGLEKMLIDCMKNYENFLNNKR